MSLCPGSTEDSPGSLCQRSLTSARLPSAAHRLTLPLNHPPHPTDHLHPQTPSQRGTWPQNPSLCVRRDGGALGKGWAAGCTAPRLTLRGVFCSPTPSRPRPGAGGQRGRHLRSSLWRQGNKHATRGWWALSCSVPMSPAPKLDSGGRSRPLKPPPLAKKPLKE